MFPTVTLASTLFSAMGEPAVEDRSQRFDHQSSSAVASGKVVSDLSAAIPPVPHVEPGCANEATDVFLWSDRPPHPRLVREDVFNPVHHV